MCGQPIADVKKNGRKNKKGVDKTKVYFYLPEVLE
jgi:hypothetical protein